MNPNDPHSPAPKKGLSGLAIVGLGCGALLIIVLLVVGFAVAKIAGKVKEVAGDDWRKNPARTAAMVAAKMNPDWDFVKADDAAGEITVRVKKTGEEITMSYNEVAQGKFKMKNSNGEETVFGGGATVPPDWVPSYPAASAQGVGMRVEKPAGVSGTFFAQTPDAPDKVREFFATKLQADGYEVTVTSAPETPVISAKKESEKRTITVQLNGANGATQVVITYEGPKSER